MCLLSVSRTGCQHFAHHGILRIRVQKLYQSFALHFPGAHTPCPCTPPRPPHVSPTRPSQGPAPPTNPAHSLQAPPLCKRPRVRAWTLAAGGRITRRCPCSSQSRADRPGCPGRTLPPSAPRARPPRPPWGCGRPRLGACSLGRAGGLRNPDPRQLSEFNPAERSYPSRPMKGDSQSHGRFPCKRTRRTAGAGGQLLSALRRRSLQASLQPGLRFPQIRHRWWAWPSEEPGG